MSMKRKHDQNSTIKLEFLQNNKVTSILPVKSMQSNEKMTIKKVFDEIIETKFEINVSMDKLDEILLEDLKLKLHKLSNSQRTALPYMLVNYMQNWPGWDKWPDFESGVLDRDSWFERFRQYIMLKMSLLVTKTIFSVTDQIEKEKSVNMVDGSTQLSEKASFATFSVEISGPPVLLSNIVFWGSKDNISIEEHSDRPWVDLDTEQLLNFPFMEVEFNSPELSFKRSCEPKINRYISGCADLIYEKPNFIMGKHRINMKSRKFLFPVEVLHEYIQLYKDTIKSQINALQQEELSVVLDQFYKDMLDIHEESKIAENRQVTFNIGRNIYKRSKKISNVTIDDKDNPIVIFNEVFTPKIISSIRYFTGMQEFDVEGKRVLSMNETNTKMMLNFKPIINYRCTYCKVNFTGITARTIALTHLETRHKREQPLLCLLCKNSFEVTHLTKRRWKCECQN